MANDNLFDSVAVEMVQIGLNTYPSLIMLPLRAPSVIYENDHYFLEKYIIDKSNLGLMEEVSNATITQSVLYYMYEGLYMATYFHMGAYGMGMHPEFIDITDYFKYANDTIVDTDTDIDTYLYIYRIIYQHNELQYASSYIVGQNTEFVNEDDIDPDLFTDDMIVVATSRGDGSLYRMSRNGKMIMKGYPMIAVSPRYKGPIESSKTNCSAYSKATALDCIEEKVEVIDEYTSNSFISLENSAKEMAVILRGKI